MALRIVYVVHQFLPDYFTGTEQYVFALAKAMQRLGHDVSVYTLDPDFAEREPFYDERHEEVEGIEVVRFRYWMHLGADFRRLEYHHPYAGQRFGEHLHMRDPDLVHVFHLRHLGANLLSETEALGIPTVVHLMDFWFVCPAVVLMRSDGSLCDGPPDDGYGCIACVASELLPEIEAEQLEPALRERASGADEVEIPSPAGSSTMPRAATYVERPRYLRDQLARADRIIAPSDFLREVMTRNGIPGESMEVVRYGVDRARLGDAARVPAEKSELRIGYFGSISDHKGVDLLVDAVMRIEGRLRVSIFGRLEDFPDFSGPLRDRASSDPRIEFLAPFPREQLGITLARIDVLVVPSRWYENTPFVVLEAFAGGVPVVATDLGGISEIIRDGEHGDLFRRGDANDLAAKLRRLVDEPKRLARYVRALPAVKTLQDNATEFEAIYQQLVYR